jgi:starch phosphorylase
MTHAKAVADYADKTKWNRMSLINIAASGFFGADRSINEYAENIWNIKRLNDKN